MKQPAAILVIPGISNILPEFSSICLPVFSRFFQYLQYWYNQYFLESSSICNTGITSIFQNLPVSAIQGEEGGEKRGKGER
jgi:hypothetical protein